MSRGGAAHRAIRLQLLAHIQAYASLSLECSMPVACQPSTARENLCRLAACSPIVRAARVMLGTQVSYCSSSSASRSLMP